jgi:hypothetical protein
MRQQIALMQTALEAAVARSAMELASQLSRVTGVAPETHLIGQPRADGFKLAGQTFFHVQVPGMSAMVLLYLPTLARAGAQPISGVAPAPPVAPVGVPAVVQLAEAEELLKDPDGAYVSAIRANLVETMLRNSQPLEIACDELLTVAARKDQRLNPLDPSSGRTMVFTVKGCDLEEYHQRRISIDEARKRVVVTTY